MPEVLTGDSTHFPAILTEEARATLGRRTNYQSTIVLVTIIYDLTKIATALKTIQPQGQFGIEGCLLVAVELSEHYESKGVNSRPN